MLVKFTPIRVICQNTRSAAFANEGRSFRVRHDQRLEERLRETGALLDMILTTYEELRLAFESMRNIILDEARLQGYLKSVFPEPQKSNPEIAHRAAQNRRMAAYLYQNGSGNTQPGV